MKSFLQLKEKKLLISKKKTRNWSKLTLKVVLILQILIISFHFSIFPCWIRSAYWMRIRIQEGKECRSIRIQIHSPRFHSSNYLFYCTCRCVWATRSCWSTLCLTLWSIGRPSRRRSATSSAPSRRPSSSSPPAWTGWRRACRSAARDTTCSTCSSTGPLRIFFFLKFLD